MQTNEATKLAEIEFAQPSGAVPASVVPPTETAVATIANQSEAAALGDFLQRAASDPRVDIDKLDRLIKMKERMDAMAAEREYDEAMAAAQEEMEPIRAASYNKHTESMYADQAALDRAIRPIYTKHGFSLSFRMGEGAPADHVRLVCRVAHRGGHREFPYIDMPADGKGARGNDVMTKTHATGAATTYGKRYLSGMIWNLAVTRDNDGNGADEDDVERLAPKNARRGPDGKLLSTYSNEQANKAQQWADEAIQYLNMCNAQQAQDWRREKQTVPKGKRKSDLELLEGWSPGQYMRVKQTYENVTGEELE